MDSPRICHQGIEYNRLKLAREHRLRLKIEPLESRRVLASAVTISEFMANNDDTLVDYYNQTSDWIELHNTSGGNIDLEGWYLTDEPGNLNKWPIPGSTVLYPNQYKIFNSQIFVTYKRFKISLFIS